MQSWPSVFAFFVTGWAAGFAFAASMYFATYFISVRWVEYWTGSAPKD